MRIIVLAQGDRVLFLGRRQPTSTANFVELLQVALQLKGDIPPLRIIVIAILQRKYELEPGCVCIGMTIIGIVKQIEYSGLGRGKFNIDSQSLGRRECLHIRNGRAY